MESRLRFSLGIGLGVLLLVSCASKPEAQQERVDSTSSILIPTEWTPSLEQVQEEVEESLAAQPQQSQQALNKTSQNLADLADARLFITYILLLQKLDEQGGAALFNEQKTWLRQREAAARAAVVSKGGSLAALEYTSAFGDMTKKRLAELESRLSQQSTPTGEPPGRGEK